MPLVAYIIIAALVVPPIGAGIAVFVKQDAKCREAGKPTRIRGAMLEVYCDDEKKEETK